VENRLVGSIHCQVLLPIVHNLALRNALELDLEQGRFQQQTTNNRTYSFSEKYNAESMSLRWFLPSKRYEWTQVLKILVLCLESTMLLFFNRSPIERIVFCKAIDAELEIWKTNWKRFEALRARATRQSHPGAGHKQWASPSLPTELVIHLSCP
jgi:hypothetical protein